MQPDAAAIELDRTYNRLTELAQTVYQWHRGKKMALPDAREFMELFRKLCPVLSDRFLPEPSPVYMLSVMEFAVDGIRNPIVAELWQSQNPIKVIVASNHYSSSTVEKYSQNFGMHIVSQLWKKNLELQGIQSTVTANPQTLEQFLRQNYDLSEGQIHVLVAFSRTDNRGRKQIAKDLVLSTNTIKAHVHAIMRKMRTKSINEAVSIAKSFVP